MNSSGEERRLSCKEEVKGKVREGDVWVAEELAQEATVSALRVDQESLIKEVFPAPKGPAPNAARK